MTQTADFLWKCIIVAFFLASEAVIVGIVFSLFWNKFIIEHVSSAHHASFGACVLTGLVGGLLYVGGRANSNWD